VGSGKLYFLYINAEMSFFSYKFSRVCFIKIRHFVNTGMDLAMVFRVKKKVILGEQM